MPGNEPQKKRWGLEKISIVLGIIISMMTISGMFFKGFSDFTEAQRQVTESIAKNREILVDDLQIRLDHTNRKIEIGELEIKHLDKQSALYREARDELYLLKEKRDSLKRLIEKARK